MFVQRVTVRVRETEKVVTGCWATEDKMRSELKYSKHLVDISPASIYRSKPEASTAQGPDQEDHRLLQEVPEPPHQDCS